MKRLISIIGLLVAIPAFADTPLIDPYQISIADKKREYLAEKCGKTNDVKQMNCQLAIPTTTLFPLRGTSYAEKTYANFSEDEAVKKFNELEAQLPKARSDTHRYENVKGELFKQQIQAEMEYLELYKMPKKKRFQMLKK